VYSREVLLEMAQATYTPRLKERYRSELREQLQRDLGLANIMQVPRPEKIVVNMGVGDAPKDARLLDGAVKDLTMITGQQPTIRRARKSIATFKIREGMPIGASVTMRGATDQGLPGTQRELVRRARQLLVRPDRAARVPGDRLRRHRCNQRNGRDDRHDCHERR
jgi:hypothetical protein